MTSYDDQQYKSFSYPLTSPAHLQTMANLFGLDAKTHQKARVLELGCAGGGNIIPLAYGHPEMDVVGIDLSSKQIEEGQHVIKTLGLKNVDLQHKSILDVDQSMGKFDYIICHGVFAWVDEQVKNKILEICRDQLTPQGVACISYNTMPCWNMVLHVRDMMLFHTRNISDPSEKVKQARTLLNFLNQGLQNETTPYAKFLRDEISIIARSEDYYIYHEYLEDQNNPIYFHEFVKSCNDFDLMYLADGHIATMFPGNLKESFREKISEIKDIVRVGQYMDFIRNQRFRTTLICHKDQKLNRNLKTEDIEQFCLAFQGRFQESTPIESINNQEPVTYQSAGITLTLKSPVAKACLKVLHDLYGKPISYQALIKAICEMTSQKEKEVKTIVNGEINLMRLVLAGMIKLYPDEGNYASELTQSPSTTGLIQYYSKAREHVPNMRHETLKLTPIERLVLQFIDGKKTVSELNEIIESKIVSKELSMKDEQGNDIVDTSQIKEKVKLITLSTLENLVKKAYLVKS